MFVPPTKLVPPRNLKSGRAPLVPTLMEPKIIMGAVDDSLEHEANSVADQVIVTSAPTVLPATPGRSSELSTSDEASQRIRMARGNGNPLEPTVHAHMERRFGRNFAEVRVHADGEAGQLNRQLGARAFTAGTDIFVDQPSSLSNRRLMAHELTHVVQQGPIHSSHRDASTSREIVIQRDTKRAAISEGKPGNRPNLDVGDAGPGVSLLQRLLGTSSTDVFDETTRKAVVSFQQARPALHPATGGVGPKTWEALDEIAKKAPIPAGAVDPTEGGVVAIREVTVEGRSQDQIAAEIKAKTGMRAYDVAKAAGVTPSTVPGSTWAGDTEANLEDAGVISSHAGPAPAVTPVTGRSAVPLHEPYDRRRRYIRAPVDDVLQYELVEFYGTAEEAEEEQNRINMQEGSDRAGAALAAAAGGGRGSASRAFIQNAGPRPGAPVGKPRTESSDPVRANPWFGQTRPEPIPDTGTPYGKDSNREIALRGGRVWTSPQTLAERVALQAAHSGEGTVAMTGPFGDPKFKDPGWVKMQYLTHTADGNKIEIHYMRNTLSEETSQFKFVSRGTYPLPQGGGNRKVPPGTPP